MPINGNPEGATGEQGASSGAVGSQDESLLGSLDHGEAPKGGVAGLDPVIAEKLRSIDPRELPDDVRIKFEKPFLSEFTKQQQALRAREAELERQQTRILELATSHLSQRGVQPTPNQMDQLREKVKNGEFTLEALPDFLDSWYRSTVQPKVDGFTVSQIMADTQREFPILADPEVARQTNQLFAQNPELAEMSRAGGMKGTHWVLRGIAQDAMYRQTKAELETLKTKYTSDIETAKRAAVDEYKRKALGLPSETSRAGSTARSTGEPNPTPTFREAADAAWEETFGKAG